MPDWLKENIKWDGVLIQKLSRGHRAPYTAERVYISMYRPFVKMHLYFDTNYINSVYRVPRMFPTPETVNQVICVTGRGSTQPFSTLMTNVVPDIQLLFNGQCFPRWEYRPYMADAPDAWTQSHPEDAAVLPGYHRVDNITDWCLHRFRTHYAHSDITKDDIWHYLYGILHAPDYRARYAADLAKDLPRIPFAPDFAAFVQAGAVLGALHMNYERCALYPLAVEKAAGTDHPYTLSTRPMRWGGTRQAPDRSVLHVNDHLTLRDIPAEAHAYTVNGRTPLEWARERLYIRQDKESGIVNDPNAWFAADPASLLSHLQRLVQVGVETARIVRGLPPALPS